MCQMSAARVVEFPGNPPSVARLLVPREHGSWALWLLPLLSGSILGSVSGQPAPALWFALVAASAFLIRQPLEALLGVSLVRLRSSRERLVAIYWIVGFAAIAAIGMFQLLRLQRVLVLALGLIALACFAVSALFRHTRSLRIPKQLIGAIGLTGTGAGAYYVTTGRLDRITFLLWLGAWLFAVSQIEYVQLRLRTANVKSRLKRARAGCEAALLHLLLLAMSITAAVFGLPALLAFAFVPAALRLLAWMLLPARQLKLYVLGFSELFQSVLFNALLTAAFLLRR